MALRSRIVQQPHPHLKSIFKDKHGHKKELKLFRCSRCRQMPAASGWMALTLLPSYQTLSAEIITRSQKRLQVKACTMMIIFALIFLLAIGLSTGTSVSAEQRSFIGYRRFNWQGSQGNTKLVCYFASWAGTRPGPGRFDVEDIDPKLCTHLIYGFAALSYDHRIRSINPKNDLRENRGKGAYQRFTALKRLNPRLKTLISVGGWNEGSIKYSYMASRREFRTAFIDSCLEFLEEYGFDGVDLAWEYPAHRGGRADDKDNYIKLLREMREKFERRRYLLTVAVSAKKDIMSTAYNVPEIAQYADFINIMTFDYHGAWENVTGHHAPLYARPDGSIQDCMNANCSINQWISLGAPASKLVMGIASFGRTFTLAFEDNNGIGAAATSGGEKGPYTEEKGSLGYNEICEVLMKGKWTIFRDQHLIAPYAYQGKTWISYDDVYSTEVKVDYAKSQGLGGIMVWSIDTDDFRGLCHRDTFPLLKAARRALEETSIPPSPPSPATTTRSTPSTTTTTTTTTAKPWWATSTTTTAKPSPTTVSTQPSTTKQTWWPPATTPSSTSRTWWPTSSTTQTWWPKSSTSQTWWSSSTTKSTTTSQPSSTKQTWWPTSPSSKQTWWTQPTTSTTTTTKRPTTTTTTRRPTTTTPPQSAIDKKPCNDPGLYPDPSHCDRFYSCVRDVDNKFRVFEYRCPPNTIFDKHLKSCRWASPEERCK